VALLHKANRKRVSAKKGGGFSKRGGGEGGTCNALFLGVGMGKNSGVEKNKAIAQVAKRLRGGTGEKASELPVIWSGGGGGNWGPTVRGPTKVAMGRGYKKFRGEGGLAVFWQQLVGLTGRAVWGGNHICDPGKCDNSLG